MRQNALPLVASTVHYCQFSCTCASNAEVQQNCCGSNSLRFGYFQFRQKQRGERWVGSIRSGHRRKSERVKRQPVSKHQARAEMKEGLAALEVVTERHGWRRKNASLLCE